MTAVCACSHSTVRPEARSADARRMPWHMLFRPIACLERFREETYRKSKWTADDGYCTVYRVVSYDESHRSYAVCLDQNGTHKPQRFNVVCAVVPIYGRTRTYTEHRTINKLRRRREPVRETRLKSHQPHSNETVSHRPTVYCISQHTVESTTEQYTNHNRSSARSQGVGAVWP